MIVVVVVAVGAVAAVFLVLHHLVFRRPLPRVNGSVTVHGLRAPVRVTRDRHGVPHIEAGSMEDAAFGCGFVHAQDRGWQLELSRRVAAGRIAEIAGSEALPADRFLRRLGLMRAAEAEARLLNGEARRMLDAYSAGVTAVLCGGQPRPAELALLRLRAEPWRPAHTLAYLRLLSLGLGLNWEVELQRLRLLQALGPLRAAAFDPSYPDENPTILSATGGPAARDGATTEASAARALASAPAPAGEAVLAMFVEAARWIPSGVAAAASNSWVVDGSLTATGRPMLCNDPHLPPLVPSIWYEVHVRAGDDFEAAGVSFPGIPFVVIGHNHRVAWGFTNSFADVQDLVIEEFDDAPARRYRTEEGVRESRVHRETIKVKGAGEVVEEVVETRHGPVLERFVAGGVTRGLALQWSALGPGRNAESLLALQRATGWDSFRAALNGLDSAPQNAVYADVDGHIGYFLTGRVPVRRRAASRLPAPGWTGEALFERFLEVDEKPQVLDPPEHLVITANNRVVGDGFAHHIGFDYMNGYRALRLEQLLAGRRGLNPAFMAAAQLDVVCPPAREVAALLRGVRSEGFAEEARRGLVAWDGSMDPEATEPAVYQAFLRRLGEGVLEPVCGDAWRLLAGEMSHPVLGFSGSLMGRLTPWLLARWRTGDESLFQGRATWPEVAGRALEEAVADLRASAGRPSRWRWGRLHAISLAHVLGARRPLGLLFNAGRVEVGGDTDTVHQTAFIPGESYATRAWAPSWRQILDVGAWDACTGIHLPGQSGHPGSRHHRDFVDAWRRNRQHPLHWTAAAVAGAAEARLILRPPPQALEAGDAEEARRAA